MRKHGLKMVVGLGLLIAAAGLGPRPVRAQFIVHDPIHTELNETKWGIQLRDMLTQIRRLEEQIELHKRRIEQWEIDFKDIWGKTSGRHEIIHTTSQVAYARQNPWFDRISTGAGIYDDFNETTRYPFVAFGQVQAVRDRFNSIRADLNRYRNLPAALKDYYRALGNLSAEGLYVSARSYAAAPTLWGDAQTINEYSKDRSPAGAAKTAAFAASVQAYAQGYQLETLNRMLRQMAYLNMKQENDQRAALLVAAGLQEALSETYRNLPVKAHVID